MKQKEVEVKYRLDKSQISKIEKKIKEIGGIKRETIEETDVYFTSPSRDFIKTKECLRIRHNAKGTEMTYKGGSTAEMEKEKQFWKEEINIPINVSVLDAVKFLEQLGFTQVAIVKKTRVHYDIGSQKVFLDELDGCGFFVEIENFSTETKKKERALAENKELAEKLGLEEKNIVELPYRDIVINHVHGVSPE